MFGRSFRASFRAKFSTPERNQNRSRIGSPKHHRSLGAGHIGKMISNRPIHKVVCFGTSTFSGQEIKTFETSLAHCANTSSTVKNGLPENISRNLVRTLKTESLKIKHNIRPSMMKLVGSEHHSCEHKKHTARTRCAKLLPSQPRDHAFEDNQFLGKPPSR